MQLRPAEYLRERRKQHRAEAPGDVRVFHWFLRWHLCRAVTLCEAGWRVAAII